MADQDRETRKLEQFNYSYPRLVRYKCHAIAYGQLRKIGPSDLTRFRKVLRLDELCPVCLSLMEVIAHPHEGEEEEDKEGDEPIGEEAGAVIELDLSKFRVIRLAHEGPWYWEHEDAAHAAQVAKENGARNKDNEAEKDAGTGSCIVN